MFIHLNLNISDSISLLSILIALILGISSLIISAYNIEKTIEITTKQYLLSDKMELLLNLNMESMKIKNKVKKDKLIKSNDLLTKKDYENYLNLINFQKLIKNNNSIITLLFPKTFEKYVKFKFNFTENINNNLQENQYSIVLSDLFKIILEKTKEESLESLKFYAINNPKLVANQYEQLKPQMDITTGQYSEKKYQSGIKNFFDELNLLNECFQKEFESQKDFYL